MSDTHRSRLVPSDRFSITIDWNDLIAEIKGFEKGNRKHIYRAVVMGSNRDHLMRKISLEMTDAVYFEPEPLEGDAGVPRPPATDPDEALREFGQYISDKAPDEALRKALDHAETTVGDVVKAIEGEMEVMPTNPLGEAAEEDAPTDSEQAAYEEGLSEGLGADRDPLIIKTHELNPQEEASAHARFPPEPTEAMAALDAALDKNALIHAEEVAYEEGPAAGADKFDPDLTKADKGFLSGLREMLPKKKSRSRRIPPPKGSPQ